MNLRRIDYIPAGSRKEYILYTAKKDQDKMIALFLSPASEKGRSTLRLGDNMWLYIPNVGKPIRSTSLQSVIGGVFNNSDILSLDYDKIEYFGNGLVRPSVLETDSPLYKGYKSVMVFAKLRKREFKDEVFTLNYLPKVDELR